MSKIPSFPSKTARFPNKRPESFEQQMDRVYKKNKEDGKKYTVINKESGDATKPVNNIKDSAELKRKWLEEHRSKK